MHNGTKFGFFELLDEILVIIVFLIGKEERE